MIIKSIYINHFGCLKDKAIEFKSGLNVISLPNESGKSTIAEFIRVMLYGVNSLRFNQRKKYMPFGYTSMGGEMTVNFDGVDYVIKRTFGMRKADDTTEVLNALTGEAVKEYSVDNVGKAMRGLSGDGYENTCYIKQLSSKINDVKSSEIQNRLINLSQSSDENYSYRSAAAILDNAIKDLNGPRGRINQVQSALNELAVRAAEKSRVKNEYEATKNELDNISKNDCKGSGNMLLLSWIPVVLSAAGVFFVKFAVILLVLFCVIAVLLTLKVKRDTAEKIEYAKHIGFLESKLEALREEYEKTDVSKIGYYKEKLQYYNKMLWDLRDARTALEKSFEQLQTDYSPKLNSMARSIFKSITDGKYVDFMVDEDYNITVRDDNNNIVSSEFLSGGTFDQIYFSLRMALVKMICENMPVVLDDAFALYDDKRVGRAMNYLKTVENQVLIFFCQKRELNLL